MSAAPLLADLSSMAASPVCWGLVIAGLGLWALLSNQRLGGIALGAIGLSILLVGLPRLGTWDEQLLFWLLAATAIVASAAAVSARNPVYTAIWFALSLVGVAGLFLLSKAQFLGVATVMVYAGAIVVTFLFVLMLAQPEGRAAYDRVSWGRSVVPVAVLAAVVLAVITAWTVESAPPTSVQSGGNLAHDQHMARVGTELFARHLLAVELAGTLLLVALIGAIAIIIHGKQRPAAPTGLPHGPEA